ncbi:MAG: hypothetical protein LUG62_02505, partial [Clostridiales bacterium]|nr:hypothetical protein [Clostridiales bacterium]
NNFINQPYLPLKFSLKINICIFPLLRESLSCCRIRAEIMLTGGQIQRRSRRKTGWKSTGIF